jgi:hypothetical protein
MHKVVLLATVLLGVSGQNAFADLVTLQSIPSLPLNQGLSPFQSVTVTQGFETFNITESDGSAILNYSPFGSPPPPYILLEASGSGDLTIMFSVPVTSISLSATGPGANNASIGVDIVDVYAETSPPAGGECYEFALGCSFLGSAIGQAAEGDLRRANSTTRVRRSMPSFLSPPMGLAPAPIS